jgi:hypothetical protein
MSRAPPILEAAGGAEDRSPMAKSIVPRLPLIFSRWRPAARRRQRRCGADREQRPAAESVGTADALSRVSKKCRPAPRWFS